MRDFLSDPFNWIGIVIAIVLILLCVYITHLIFTPQAQRDFERRNAFMQVCLQSEFYSRAECIQLAGKVE